MGPHENPTRHDERQAAQRAETAVAPAADPAVPAEGMRTAVSPTTRAAAVLQRWLPQGGAARGRSGRPGRSTGPRRRANRSGTSKAGATGSASKSENHQRKRQFRRPRGSSLRSFFDGCCDRPGCYECFVRSRRSPLQRFCSPACQRAMERVWERERRWHRRHARRRPPSWKVAPRTAAVRAHRPEMSLPY